MLKRHRPDDPFTYTADAIGHIIAKEYIGGRGAGIVPDFQVRGQKRIGTLFDERENYPRPVKRIDLR